MAKNLFIFGCSGVAKSIVDSINRSSNYHFKDIIFVEKKLTKKDETYYGCRVIDKSALKDIETIGHFVIFSFFKPKDIITRNEFITQSIDEFGLELISIIDPLAVVSPTASIGRGCYIAPFACVDSDSLIASNSIILFHSIISREVKIFQPSFISAGCTIKGGVKIKESCFLGANSSVIKNINAICFVNAMTLCTQEVNEPSILYNVPKLYTIKLTTNKAKAYKRLESLG